MLRTVNVHSLRFKHFVVATSQSLVFASARDNDEGIHNFIIDLDSNHVMEQVNGHFELLSKETADSIRTRAEVYYTFVPVYKTDILHFS